MSEPILKCYRTACTKAAHPCGYHRITHGLYCLACARMIDDARTPGQSTYFPALDHDLVLSRDWSGGSYTAGLIVVRPQGDWDPAELDHLRTRVLQMEDPLRAAVQILVGGGNNGPYLLSEIRRAEATFRCPGDDPDASNFRKRATKWIDAGVLVLSGMKPSGTRLGRAYRYTG